MVAGVNLRQRAPIGYCVSFSDFGVTLMPILQSAWIRQARLQHFIILPNAQTCLLLVIIAGVPPIVLQSLAIRFRMQVSFLGMELK